MAEAVPKSTAQRLRRRAAAAGSAPRPTSAPGKLVHGVDEEIQPLVGGARQRPRAQASCRAGSLRAVAVTPSNNRLRRTIKFFLNHKSSFCFVIFALFFKNTRLFFIILQMCEERKKYFFIKQHKKLKHSMYIATFRLCLEYMSTASREPPVHPWPRVYCLVSARGKCYT